MKNEKSEPKPLAGIAYVMDTEVEWVQAQNPGVVYTPAVYQALTARLPEVFKRNYETSPWVKEMMRAARAAKVMAEVKEEEPPQFFDWEAYDAWRAGYLHALAESTSARFTMDRDGFQN